MSDSDRGDVASGGQKAESVMRTRACGFAVASSTAMATATATATARQVRSSGLGARLGASGYHWQIWATVTALRPKPRTIERPPRPPAQSPACASQPDRSSNGPSTGGGAPHTPLIPSASRYTLNSSKCTFAVRLLASISSGLFAAGLLFALLLARPAAAPLEDDDEEDVDCCILPYDCGGCCCCCCCC